MADYLVVPNAGFFCCLALLQQLQVTPLPGIVGEPVSVRAVAAGQPVAGLPVDVEEPDGTRRSIGATDGDGRSQFEPSLPGTHTLVAQIRGVRVLAPHRVVARRSGWPLAFGCVPIGLAVIWSLARARSSRRAASVS